MAEELKTTPLNTMKDRHKGKIGFVLGSGYSLKDFARPEILSRGIVFACNSAVMSIDRCDYYCFADPAVPNYMFYDQALEKTNSLLICGKEHIVHLNDAKNGKEAIAFRRRMHDGDNWKCDLSDGLLLLGHTIVHCAIHIAAVCGCDPIILIGVDGDWRAGQRYAVDWPELIKKDENLHSPDNKPEYFLNVGGKDRVYAATLDGLERIKKQNPGINILNGSLGVFEIFTRINLNTYFN